MAAFVPPRRGDTIWTPRSLPCQNSPHSNRNHRKQQSHPHSHPLPDLIITKLKVIEAIEATAIESIKTIVAADALNPTLTTETMIANDLAVPRDNRPIRQTARMLYGSSTKEEIR